MCVFVVIKLLLGFVFKVGTFTLPAFVLGVDYILHWNITYSVFVCVCEHAHRCVDVDVGVVLVVRIGVYL